MTDHNLFYYPYASLTNAHLQQWKVAALYFDKLYILEPVRSPNLVEFLLDQDHPPN